MRNDDQVRGHDQAPDWPDKMIIQFRQMMALRGVLHVHPTMISSSAKMELQQVERRLYCGQGSEASDMDRFLCNHGNKDRTRGHVVFDDCAPRRDRILYPPQANRAVFPKHTIRATH